MQAGIVFVFALCVGLALCAPQPNLYPIKADGIETVFLDDMSFVNEINLQMYTPTDFNMYIYGHSNIRTVYPGPNFYVGRTPNENWHIPFIDFHTVQNGTDIWGVGPVNAIYARNRNHTNPYQGYQFEVAVVTTKQFPNGGNNGGRFFLEQPLNFEGTFYSLRVYGYDHDKVTGYFCGFFPNHTNPGQLHFGVLRAHFNVSLLGTGVIPDGEFAWYHNRSLDYAILYHTAQFVSFHADFKPMLFHTRNFTSYAPPGTVHVAVVDPYNNNVQLVTGNIDPNMPLFVSSFSWVPTYGGLGAGFIVSGALYHDILLIGVAVSGRGTGWIDVLHLVNLTQKADTIALPTNYSDPRSLVVDEANHVLYVGMNGGASILKIDLTTFKIVGHQNLPVYLHRTWRGHHTREHIYYITNEQHSKVYRVGKADFCATRCPEFGFCQAGKCVCGDHWQMKDNKCEWKDMITEKEKAKQEKGGEIALGIFFALMTVAAAAGWYLVWKGKHGYQAV